MKNIVFPDFDPRAGHEQKGRRPALVARNNLTMVCPITHSDRGHPFHIRLDSRTKTSGVILCVQVGMFDMNSRNAGFEEKAPPDIVAEAADMIIGFMEIKYDFSYYRHNSGERDEGYRCPLFVIVRRFTKSSQVVVSGRFYRSVDVPVNLFYFS